MTKFNQQWTGIRIHGGLPCETFPAAVPGNIQLDYACAVGWNDIMYGENCTKFAAIEDDAWEYRAALRYDRQADERVRSSSICPTVRPASDCSITVHLRSNYEKPNQHYLSRAVEGYRGIQGSAARG